MPSLFSRFAELRSRRILERHPIPDAAWERAVADRPILRKLDADELRRLRALATVFLHDKTFHCVQGAEIDEDFTVAVAALGCLPVLELGLRWYSDWKTIIVAPDAYEITRSETDEAGVVHEYQDELGGEVLHIGPVVLSRTDADEAGRGDGYNVVVHELAHKIDGRSGSFDGCPPLPPDISLDEWRTAFSAAYDRMRAAPRRGRSGRIRIDSYAAFSPDEFFAVCVEYFFDNPVVLRGDFPDVYALLSRFFRQDPFARLSRR
jgi:Mlc titration factor MtfA (ptsG expression regulator)